MAGDELLRRLGEILPSRIRRRDTLARLGGDEFGVLLEHCTLDQALRVAESLREAIGGFRFWWGERSFALGVSIGLVPIGESSQSTTSVLRAADSACYVAKDLGGNRLHIYREDGLELANRRGQMQWFSRIDQALEANRFRLSFQPIKPISGGVDDGPWCELLLRMEDDDGRRVLPNTFLPAAERYNLATRIDGWVIRAAFDWLTRHPEHLAGLHLCSINLSGQSLANEEFQRFVVRRFRESAIPAEKICFEITETAAIADMMNASRFIGILSDLGCRLALDDFGSGLSSFAYLKAMPVDFLKIDGVFVKDVAENPLDLAMVRSINEIGHVMGMRTIAEFVEDQPTLDKLRELGVDYAQGYCLGRPRPLESFGRTTA